MVFIASSCLNPCDYLLPSFMVVSAHIFISSSSGWHSQVPSTFTFGDPVTSLQQYVTPPMVSWFTELLHASPVRQSWVAAAPAQQSVPRIRQSSHTTTSTQQQNRCSNCFLRCVLRHAMRERGNGCLWETNTSAMSSFTQEFEWIKDDFSFIVSLNS